MKHAALTAKILLIAISLTVFHDSASAQMTCSAPPFRGVAQVEATANALISVVGSSRPSSGSKGSSPVTSSKTDAKKLEEIALRQVRAPLPAVYKQRGRVGANGYRRSTYHCGAYVRVALEKAGLIKKGGLHGSAQAKMYGCGLHRNGFHNACGGSNGCARKSPTCKINPSAAPVGSVLVYDSTGCGHPAGHIEIKTSKGYVSDYVSARPRTGGPGAIGSCRRLIGVWTK